jgi:DNA-binding IclR family transcriptional regulator
MPYRPDPDLERRLLDAIRSYRYSPTVRELARTVGEAQTRVHLALIALESRGEVERAGEQRRICVR